MATELNEREKEKMEMKIYFPHRHTTNNFCNYSVVFDENIVDIAAVVG